MEHTLNNLIKFSSTDTENPKHKKIQAFHYDHSGHVVTTNSHVLFASKKPWEIKHIDTMELWKFGDFKNYTSLNLLTYVFNIPTPKDDMDGSMVAKVFYEEDNLERIVTYCEKDVVATIQLFRKYEGKPLIDEEFIQLA